MARHSALAKHLYAAATSLAGVKQATVNRNDQFSTGREAKCGIYNVIRAFRELEQVTWRGRRLFEDFTVPTCRAVEEKNDSKAGTSQSMPGHKQRDMRCESPKTDGSPRL